MSNLDNLSPEDLSILSSVLAIIISKGRGANEINVLGNLLAAIGTIMTTISAQQQLLTAKDQNAKKVED